VVPSRSATPLVIRGSKFFTFRSHDGPFLRSHAVECPKRSERRCRHRFARMACCCESPRVFLESNRSDGQSGCTHADDAAIAQRIGKIRVRVSKEISGLAYLILPRPERATLFNCLGRYDAEHGFDALLGREDAIDVRGLVDVCHFSVKFQRRNGQLGLFGGNCIW
jgi:hypothetical protein